MTTRALAVLVLLTATARADLAPPPPPPPPPKPATQTVAPGVLEGSRIAGEKAIVPDDATKIEITRSGKEKTISSFKLCLGADGGISGVTQLKSSGFPAYDKKIISTIKSEWKYKPFLVNGKAVPVCTAVTFIYSQAPADPAVAPAPATFKLIKPGKDPTHVLRLMLKKGDKHTVVLTSQETRARGAKGKLGPAEIQPMVRFEIAYEVTDVAASGDARVDLSYGKVELVAAKPDAAAKTMNEKLAKVAGTKAHVTITPRGQVKDFELAAAPGVAPEMRQALESTRDMFPQLAQELPEPALGNGAVWETVSTVTAGEMTVLVTTSHEVTAIDGTKVTVKVTQKQDGKGSGPGNLTAHATGSGESVIDLASALPTKVKFDLAQDIELDSDGTKLAQHGTTVVTLTAR